MLRSAETCAVLGRQQADMTSIWATMVLGSRTGGLGLRGLGFRGVGFRSLGVEGLGDTGGVFIMKTLCWAFAAPLPNSP